MCGIAGLWSKTRPTSASELAPALTRMRHRGPDDEGFLVVETTVRRATPLGGDDTPAELSLRSWRTADDVTGDVVLGHRRLSILDLSPRGHQPMQSVDGKCWIVFNGEIYNYIELRDELRAAGHTFHTGTDTEVILHAWQQWGRDCLHRFNGDWAFAVLDLGGADAELLVARDRWGVKPLFYAQTEDAFWFASEAKALIGHAVPFQPREYAVVRFLAGELPPGDGIEGFFDGIRQIPPGGALHVTRAGTEPFRWYDLRKAAATVTTPDESTVLGELEKEITRAVNIRLRADVPVGSCLSGGVDSSCIVGLMRGLLDEQKKGDLHTFSAVYRDRGTFNEIDWIKQVVDHTKASAHYTFPDDVPLGEMFDRMVWHQDEPFQTASIFAQWCVMREARANNVVVLLDGQAADELFGGYQPGTYQERFLEWLSRGQWLTFAREWIARKSATQLPWSVLIGELGQILLHGATGVLRLEKSKLNPRERLLNMAFKEDVVESLHPKSQTDETLIRAKLADDKSKLAAWEAKLAKKPGDTALQEKIARKKQQIASNLHKLARSNPGGWDGSLVRAADHLKIIWNRLRGRPKHELRDYLIDQTTSSSIAHLLRFEDRNSMAFSIEARVPFTDFELVEWAFKRANEFKIRRGWTKWALRTAMKGRVPESILWRRDKIGFETPDVKMSRQLLQASGRDPSHSPHLAAYLKSDAVRAVCERVRTGTASRDDGRLVWRWLVLDSWFRQFTGAGEEAKTQAVAA